MAVITAGLVRCAAVEGAVVGVSVSVVGRVLGRYRWRVCTQPACGFWFVVRLGWGGGGKGEG